MKGFLRRGKQPLTVGGIDIVRFCLEDNSPFHPSFYEKKEH